MGRTRAGSAARAVLILAFDPRERERMGRAFSLPRRALALRRRRTFSHLPIRPEKPSRAVLPRPERRHSRIVPLPCKCVECRRPAKTSSRADGMTTRALRTDSGDMQHPNPRRGIQIGGRAAAAAAGRSPHARHGSFWRVPFVSQGAWPGTCCIPLHSDQLIHPLAMAKGRQCRRLAGRDGAFRTGRAAARPGVRAIDDRRRSWYRERSRWVLGAPHCS